MSRHPNYCKYSIPCPDGIITIPLSCDGQPLPRIWKAHTGNVHRVSRYSSEIPSTLGASPNSLRSNILAITPFIPIFCRQIRRSASRKPQKRKMLSNPHNKIVDMSRDHSLATLQGCTYIIRNQKPHPLSHKTRKQDGASSAQQAGKRTFIPISSRDLGQRFPRHANRLEPAADINLRVRLSAEVPSRRAVRRLQVPLEDRQFLVSTLNHKPMSRSRAGDPANLTLKLLHARHAFSVQPQPGRRLV